MTVITAFAIFIIAAAISYILLLLLRPLLQRYALALPNARSSHRVPTPQGAGIGVIAATVSAVIGASALLGIAGPALWLLLPATIFIAVVGVIDDIRPIAVLPRLVMQALAVAAIIAAVPDDLRILPLLPFGVERALAALAVLWFVNLVNFMDGIDWITAAETVPVCAGLAAIGALGVLAPIEIVVALALAGAVAGFAPLNRPVAKMFLGDVGSLAIGLLLGWLLVGLAARGHLVAALLLPLYYLADATITLFRRMARREKFWVAHRTHFYQRATDRGFTVMEIVTRIFAVNVVLAFLAVVSVAWPGLFVETVALLSGAALVSWLLYSFATGRRAIR